MYSCNYILYKALCVQPFEWKFNINEKLGPMFYDAKGQKSKIRSTRETKGNAV